MKTPYQRAWKGETESPSFIPSNKGQSTRTDKKENQIFLIYKEIQSGAVAKSHMSRLTASLYMGKYLRISSYFRKPFLIFDFATPPL
jgi:hypothetical protein